MTSALPATESPHAPKHTNQPATESLQTLAAPVARGAGLPPVSAAPASDELITYGAAPATLQDGGSPSPAVGGPVMSHGPGSHGPVPFEGAFAGGPATMVPGDAPKLNPASVVGALLPGEIGRRGQGPVGGGGGGGAQIVGGLLDSANQTLDSTPVSAPPASPAGPAAHPEVASGAPVAARGSGAQPMRPGESPRQYIGRYEVLRLLGEGGFGSVYLAEQKVPVRRKVALKVVKLGMDTAEVLQRFEAERQALALMDHPNVARVFDAGVTERGQPYFAMEFVEGVPLNRYVDENVLGLDERLEVFNDICRAVQHAHGKGLIHRDLKPGNIIVVTVDGKPLPKVIDFGIAKATGPSLTDTNFHTETGRLIGTPEYMSPEQCSGSADIDTRTDVYALGVILYELLTGQLPFDSKTLRAGGLDGITRIIREVEPPRPSARVTSLDPGKDVALVERITRTRKMDLRALQRAIKGDLDWIVLKAIEKDRNRRYDTAYALAMDVQRHLDNQPVEAGPPDFAYRFGKFARRNKLLLAAGSAVAASLVVGLVVSTTLYFRAEDAREKEAAARVLAEERRQLAERREEEARQALKDQSSTTAEVRLQADAAEAVGSFLSGMLEAVDPARARGREVTVREIVSSAARDLSAGKLRDRPVSEARLRSTLGNTLRTLGLAGPAEEQLRAGLSALATVPVPDRTLELSLTSRLGLALRDQQKFNESLDAFEKALKLAGDIGGAQSLDAGTVSQNIGLVYMDIGRYGEAQSYLRRAFDIYAARLAPEDGRIAIVRNNLAASYRFQGDFEQAETLYRQALAAIEKQYGPDHPATAAALRDLALTLYARLPEGPGRETGLPAVVDCVTRAVVIWKKVLPPNHPDYRQVLDLRGDALRELGDYSGAREVIRESLAIREQYVGHDSMEACEALANLANLYQRENKFSDALGLSTDLIDRARRGLDAGNPDQAKLLASYDALHGTLLLDSGRAGEAEPFIRKALAVREKLFGVGQWQRANSLSLLGACLAAQGKFTDAEPMLFEAYQVLRTDRSAPPVTVQRGRARLVQLYQITNRPDEAAKVP